jgi:hypothetical protein
MSNLRRLPGTELTPEAILRDLLEQIHTVRGVTVVVESTDGKLYSGWSKMSAGASCAAAMVLMRDVGNALYVEGEEVEGDDDVG